MSRHTRLLRPLTSEARLARPNRLVRQISRGDISAVNATIDRHEAYATRMLELRTQREIARRAASARQAEAAR